MDRLREWWRRLTRRNRKPVPSALDRALGSTFAGDSWKREPTPEARRWLDRPPEGGQWRRW